MSDENDDFEDEDLEDEDSEDDLKKKKWSGKKIVLFGVAPALVVLIALGAGYFFLFASGDGHDVAEGGEAAQELDIADVIFYDLPEILVTLNSVGGATNYLKIKVSLELEDDGAVARLEALLPRIVDNFQVYLRELRIEDLNGSAGLFRLKEELLVRVNAAVHPVRINDVLFREMLVQ